MLHMIGIQYFISDERIFGANCTQLVQELATVDKAHNSPVSDLGVRIPVSECFTMQGRPGGLLANCQCILLNLSLSQLNHCNVSAGASMGLLPFT